LHKIERKGRLRSRPFSFEGVRAAKERASAAEAARHGCAYRHD